MPGRDRLRGGADVADATTAEELARLAAAGDRAALDRLLTVLRPEVVR
ncbi:RNA polymerase subunit sigma-24, partial [Streptomyces sp. SID4982]|nr:RNA polymerase subunit sigma-24 [Streptomyces sp. SID4982]